MEQGVVTEIQQLVKKPFELGGFNYRPSDWVAEDPASLVKAGPQAKHLAVATLGAVRDYLQANKDGLDLSKLVAYVSGANAVNVLGPLDTRSRVREHYLVATATDLTDGFLGQFHSIEQFIVGLQVRFADADDRTNVLRLLSSVKHETVRQSQDDGITQTVQAKAGVVLVSDVAVPNPVKLTGYRTFRDIVQPSSLFVLRVQSGRQGGLPEVGLFEGDGGAWRLTSVERVKDWLVAALPTSVAVLA